MKKICILSTVNFKHMTMISLYTDFLKKNGIDFDVIYIDKYGEIESNNANNLYSYAIEVKRDWSVFKKIKKYYGFKRFAKSIIKEKNYDFLIVWNSFTAILFVDFLVFYYKNKYCLNIRDYNKEKLLPIYFLMKVVIKFASFTTISSEGFKKFLPPSDYINVYSFNQNIFKKLEPRKHLRPKGEPLRVTFMGYVRFFDVDKKILDELGNDNRFIIQYFGEGSEILAEYAKEKNYTNVRFHGRFDSQETFMFLDDTDIINNLYGTGTPGLRTALSIKLYYAVYMKMPILVNEGTYMHEVSKKYNMNISINKSEFRGLGDKIYNSYYQLDFEELNKGCITYIKTINDNKAYFEKLIKRNLL